MVAQVQPGSPAAQAGLHNFDILLSYDDQKLFSADQLSALVANDQPGRKVRLQVVHAGKVGDVQVELGQGAAQQPMPWQAAPLPDAPSGNASPHEAADAGATAAAGDFERDL